MTDNQQPVAKTPGEPEPASCLWAEKELKNQDEQYHLLVESLNEGLVVRDANGLISYANQRFCSLLGYTREEILGRPVEDFLDEENREILHRQIAERMQGKQENYELTWTGKGGRGFHTILAPKPIFDGDGRFKGSFATIADITGLKRAEAELRESTKMLELLSSRLLKVQDELAGIRETIRQGRPGISPALSGLVTGMLVDTHQGAAQPAELAPITPRQQEILKLIAQGHTSKEIARRLYISVRTVENHRAHIMKKLGVRKDTELVRRAIAKGYIPMLDPS